MKSLVPLGLLSIFVACSTASTGENPPVDSNAPKFEDIDHFIRHSATEDRQDNSCNCIQLGNCVSGLRVQPVFGYSEERSQACDWDSASQVLTCSYEQRFVEKVPALPDEESQTNRFRDAPGPWYEHTISTKRIKTDNATEKWCRL